MKTVIGSFRHLWPKGHLALFTGSADPRLSGGTKIKYKLFSLKRQGLTFLGSIERGAYVSAIDQQKKNRVQNIQNGLLDQFPQLKEY